MPSFAILTNVGRNKEALSVATGQALDVAEMAWGDGPRIPAGNETALENEQGRKSVAAQGVTVGALNTAFFEILLAEDEGPYVIREAGLFDADGDMIAIGHYDPPINKPRDTVSATLRMSIVFSDLENLILRIDSTTAFVPASRELTAGTGLNGGGDLSADRRFDVDFASVPEAVAGLLANKALSPATSAAQISAAIDALVNGAPGALDTLKELADKLGDNDDAITALTELIAENAGRGIPLGAISAFQQTVAPDGWLICDGAPVTALYPELRTHLLAQDGVQVDDSGDPLLPDFRGEFIRGLDAGRGIDAGRVLWSGQASEFESHTHGILDESGGNGEGIAIDTSLFTDGINASLLEARTEATGGSETRPRNIAALICMKAFGGVTPTGMADLSELLNAIATQVAAEAGLNNTKLMTPLRTAQAIARARGVMIVQDRKANGVAAQSLTADIWNRRDLNTVTVNTISGASLAAGSITLPAGTYLIDADVPGYRVDGHAARLFNQTDGVVVEYGQLSTSAASAGYGTNSSKIAAQFTLAGPKALVIDHFVDTTYVNGGGDGRAVHVDLGPHIFTQIKIERVS